MSVLSAALAIAAFQSYLFSDNQQGYESALSAELPLGSSRSEAGVNGGRHTYTRERDGLFRISADVNGNPVTFVVDTGASVVVLSKSEADRIGLAPIGKKAGRMQTASGYVNMGYRESNHFDVAGRQLGRVEVAVMEGGPEVSLLGLNALSKMGPVQIDGETLTIG